ncbi:LemA family protein [Pseudidiomarina aestuarii]|uniref:LemA family protein n=1 Tax=Pseudidiomarina aestuarii TaxID=624146 RepID=A0A6N4DJ33_9GAMM|nr:LemA family protein [Pseudidiomarina aestuarii]
MGTGWILLIVVVLLFVYLIGIYNKLVRLRNQFENAFAQIEVQLKRRYDLIPNLVETAKAYLKHERETLESVIAARNQAAAALPKAAKNPSDGAAMAQLGGAEGALGSALGRLNVVMEAYPDLKANQNMMQVSEELTSTENRVAFARQAFNDAVMTYNTYRQSFPPVAVASFFGHSKDASLLEFADSAEIQAAPKVQF